jgi:hypothetical protein
MKTSRTIALAAATLLLAAAALALGATVTPISGTAVAGGGGPDKWCGAAVCPPKQTPVPYRGR